MSAIKILHTSDWHLGKRLSEFSRLEEQREIMQELIVFANAESVDAVVVGGDLFDLFQPSHETQELLYQTLFQLCDNGKRPVVAIAGNHDSHALIEAPLPLAKELGILLLGANHAPMASITNAKGVDITIPENGMVQLFFPDKQRKVNIIVAPYANEQLLKIYLGEEKREEELREILKLKWADLGRKYFLEGDINLFLGHFFFMKKGGSQEEEPEGERSILHIGGAQALFTDGLPDGLHYAALGHLHRYHAVDQTRFPVVYAGSILQYSFSESGQPKVALLLNFTEKLEMSELQFSKGYTLERKSFESFSEALSWLQENQNTYVELTMISDDALEASSRKALLAAHSRIVYLIPKRKNIDATSSNMVNADDIMQDIPTLFKKYFESEKGQEPSAEIMDLLTEVVSKGGEK